MVTWKEVLILEKKMKLSNILHQTQSKDKEKKSTKLTLQKINEAESVESCSDENLDAIENSSN